MIGIIYLIGFTVTFFVGVYYVKNDPVRFSDDEELAALVVVLAAAVWPVSWAISIAYRLLKEKDETEN